MMERVGAYTNTMQDGMKETHIFYKGYYPDKGNIVQGLTGIETEIIVRNYIPYGFYKDNTIRCDLCEPFTQCTQQLGSNEVLIDRNGYEPLIEKCDINECTKFRNSIGVP